MFTDDYRVLFEKYAEKHYIKDFEKKYKSHWGTTRKALVSELRRLDRLVENQRTNPPIHMTTDRTQWILKHEFAIAGQRVSRKASGCRLIAHVNENKRTVTILLVYHKSHIEKTNNETSWWQNVIKSEYKQYLRDFNF